MTAKRLPLKTKQRRNRSDLCSMCDGAETLSFLPSLLFFQSEIPCHGKLNGEELQEYSSPSKSSLAMTSALSDRIIYASARSLGEEK